MRLIPHPRHFGRRSVLLGVAVAIFVLLTAGTALGALVSGTLPAAGFTYTSDTINSVNMAGTGIHLKTKGTVDVKTTYSRVAPDPAFQAGWHYHNGPVIVTVTAGTLTFFDDACESWDVIAGQTYIETTGQVLNAKVLPAKNAGVALVEWFTVRLYPDGAADPVPVDAPCTP
jgi:quercetin dioxygenase-like cupin family protein